MTLFMCMCGTKGFSGQICVELRLCKFMWLFINMKIEYTIFYITTSRDKSLLLPTLVAVLQYPSPDELIGHHVPMALIQILHPNH